MELTKEEVAELAWKEIRDFYPSERKVFLEEALSLDEKHLIITALQWARYIDYP